MDTWPWTQEGIGAGEDLNAASIWIVFVAMGPEENLGRMWLDRPSLAPGSSTFKNWSEEKQNLSKGDWEVWLSVKEKLKSVWFYESPRRKCWEENNQLCQFCFWELEFSVRMKNWSLNLAALGCWYFDKSRAFLRGWGRSGNDFSSEWRPVENMLKRDLE